MQCVILDGGLGIRVPSGQQQLPVSLTPVQHRPFLFYQLAWLAKQGVEDVLICMGQGGEQIQRYAEDGRTWGLHVGYISEGSHLRGSGGALRIAAEQKALEPLFFVTHSDLYLPADLAPIWNYFETRADAALMVVRPAPADGRRPDAAYDGDKVIRFDRKKASRDMTHVHYGLSLIKAATVKSDIPPDEAHDIGDMFHRLSLRGRLAGFEVRTPAFEAGSAEDLRRLENYLAKPT